MISPLQFKIVVACWNHDNILLKCTYAVTNRLDRYEENRASIDTLNDVHLTLEPFKKSNSSIFLARTLRIRANESKLYE